jgi:hypothetical protein
MKDFGGIKSPFDNAIAPVHGGTDSTNADDRGGVDLRDGTKQTGGGETGAHVTTVSTKDSDTNPMTAGKGIYGS